MAVDQVDPSGLSGQTAFHRLVKDLRSVLDIQRSQIDAKIGTTLLTRLRRSLSHNTSPRPLLCWTYALVSLLCSILVLLSSVCDPVDVLLLISAILMLTITVLNVCLTVAVRTRRLNEGLRKAERLCVDLAKYAESDCGEPSLRYADLLSPMSESIDVQWTMRDGQLVNLPWMLIVQGDVIHIRPGRRVPVRCRPLPVSDKNHAIDAVLMECDVIERGRIYSPEPKIDPVTGGVLPLTTMQCVVLDTFAADHVRTMCTAIDTRPVTLVDRELQRTLHDLLEKMMLPIVLSVGVLVAVWSYVMRSYSTTLADSLLFVITATLPIVGLAVPTFVLFVNLWNVAYLLASFKHGYNTKSTHGNGSHSTESMESSRLVTSDTNDHNNTMHAAQNTSSLTHRLTEFRQLLSDDPEHLPYSANILYGLGTMTSMSVVDRKGLLSWPNPTPEKVGDGSVFFMHQSQQQQQQRALRRGTECSDDNNESLSPGDVSAAVLQCTESKCTPMVLDLTHEPDRPFTVHFDDPSWRQYMPNLRPLGASIELNCCDVDDFYIKFHDHLTVVSDSVPRTIAVINRRCCCELAGLLGFKQAPMAVRKSLTGPKQRPGDKQVVGVYSRRPGQPPLHGLAKHRTPLANLVATVSPDKLNGHRHLMAQGTADLLLQTCSHYWNGASVCELTRAIRKQILDFYHRNSMTSYCVAFAYRPVSSAIDDSLGRVYVDWPLDTRRQQNVRHATQHRTATQARSLESLLIDDFVVESTPILSSRDYIERVLKEQIFLGMITMQYQAKTEIVRMVEQLENAFIRFVHFSKENELRSRIFAEKLGIEAGWNCHISLAAEGSLDWTHRIMQYTRQETFNSNRFAAAAHVDRDSKRRPSLPKELKVELPLSVFKLDALNDDSGMRTPLVTATVRSCPNNGMQSCASAPLAQTDVSLDITLDNDAESDSVGLTMRISAAAPDSDNDQSLLMPPQTPSLRRGDVGTCGTLSHATSHSSGISDSEGAIIVPAGVLPNKARLPVGIEQVRPHLCDVDNVPLLVSLFTDCDHASSTEMIAIMQEYGEIVCVLGSSLNAHNMVLFCQADISISLQPSLPQQCARLSIGQHHIPPQQHQSADHLAARIMSLPCSLAVHSGQPLHLLSLIGHSRHLVANQRAALLFMLFVSVSMCMTQLLSACLLVPPVFTLPQLCVWLLCAVPVLCVTLACGTQCQLQDMLSLTTPKNERIVSRKVIVQNCRAFGVKFVPAIVIVVVSYVCLHHLWCRQLMTRQPTDTLMSECTWHDANNNVTLIDNTTTTAFSGNNTPLMFCARHFASLMFTLFVLCGCSLGFVNYRRLSWQGKTPLSNWTWLLACLWCLTLQVLLYVIESALHNVPSCQSLFGTTESLSVLAVCLALLIVVLVVNELYKWQEVKLFSRDQRRRKLNFGTKLGMNSPY